ncbi:MAG: FAD-binding protein [Candidatus Levybacteria bacterium]|nr:FAD-binding protein [Candidatus Levybacteria bacterium]
MNNVLLTFEGVLGANKIKQNEPMLLHTACKIGGPAEFYVEVDKTDDFVNIVLAARKMQLPVFVLGGGSNIIVSDKGIKGLVIKNNCRRFEIASMKGSIKNQRLDVAYALVFAEAGALMNQLVRFTIEQGFSGLEYALGLPGTVGGAVFTNVHFSQYNISIWDCVQNIRVLTHSTPFSRSGSTLSGIEGSTKSGEIQDIEGKPKASDIIVSVMFRCTPFDKKTLWERGTEAVMKRNDILPPGDIIGYIFKDIGIAAAMNIPTPGHTTSPAFLIKQSGLAGKRIGDAVISDLNPNYIINAGEAKSSDVLALIRLIKDDVFKKFGVTLEVDLKVVGGGRDNG